MHPPYTKLLQYRNNYSIYLNINKAQDLPTIILNMTYLLKYTAQDLPEIILNMIFQNIYRAQLQDLPRIILNMTYLLNYTAQDLPGIILNMIFRNVYRAQDLPRIILNDMYPQGIFVCIFLYLALLRSRGRRLIYGTIACIVYSTKKIGFGLPRFSPRREFQVI